MFDLVADVEHYPEFVPLCQALRVRRRSEDEQGVEVLVADMEVGIAPSTRNSPPASRSTGRG